MSPPAGREAHQLHAHKRRDEWHPRPVPRRTTFGASTTGADPTITNGPRRNPAPPSLFFVPTNSRAVPTGRLQGRRPHRCRGCGRSTSTPPAVPPRPGNQRRNPSSPLTGPVPSGMTCRFAARWRDERVAQRSDLAGRINGSAGLQGTSEQITVRPRPRRLLPESQHATWLRQSSAHPDSRPRPRLFITQVPNDAFDAWNTPKFAVDRHQLDAQRLG